MSLSTARAFGNEHAQTFQPPRLWVLAVKKGQKTGDYDLTRVDVNLKIGGRRAARAASGNVTDGIGIEVSAMIR